MDHRLRQRRRISVHHNLSRDRSLCYPQRMIDLPSTPETAAPLVGKARLKAWSDLLLVDHGFLRELYLHKHKVTDDLWRAAQPGPRHLAKAARDGFRTILNLRGARANDGGYLLEREACERHGLTLVNFPIRSRGPLERQTLLAALDIWETMETPILMHCKSGADRTGFMSTLYLWQREGRPLKEAMGQLSLRYGHIRQAKTGILDFFFDTYAAREAETGIGFRDWVETEYDPSALKAAFKAQWFAGMVVDKILRRE